MSPLLTATDLGFQVGGHQILRDVSMTLTRGEIVTIVGPNGSGKTTLMRMLIGGLAPTSGRIELQPDLRIGYVPQRLSIDYTLPVTVDRFLALGERSRAKRLGALERVGAQGLAPRQLIELSGGQFQRVLLAHALLRAPDLLVLDEAAQGLDQPGIAHFYRLIEAIRQELGCGIVMVSHDLHVVMSASDRVICLNGYICCQGTPLAISGMPEYRALFGIGTQGALSLYRHHHDHAHQDGAEGHHHASTDPAA
ncbi:MAG: metal ABC transporter ATP-binding protein [Pseudomonadota bacterium]